MDLSKSLTNGKNWKIKSKIILLLYFFLRLSFSKLIYENHSLLLEFSDQ